MIKMQIKLLRVSSEKNVDKQHFFCRDDIGQTLKFNEEYEELKWKGQINPIVPCPIPTRTQGSKNYDHV